MTLHLEPELFSQLIILTSRYRSIPERAVRRDYWIVYMFMQLSKSDYVEKVVFKGGTSLSKCYPNSIDRFSEDIDLTFNTNENLTSRQYEQHLKTIEKIMTNGLLVEKINTERSERNKSSYVWFNDANDKVKFEIGSSVRPDPFGYKKIKSYIQEYLEYIGNTEAIRDYGLKEVSIQVLHISRTFIDKLFAIKRHTLGGTIKNKIRHIYDVTKIYNLDEIQEFLSNKPQLKQIISLTKATDTYYLEKRCKSTGNYNSLESYNFEQWKELLHTDELKNSYESLHIDLLYTNDKQLYERALNTLEVIGQLFIEIDE